MTHEIGELVVFMMFNHIPGCWRMHRGRVTQVYADHKYTVRTIDTEQDYTISESQIIPTIQEEPTHER